MLEIGLEGNKSVRVIEENTAAAMGSGDLPVFATPALVALMEGAAAESVAPHLAQGQTTVGTSINVRHTAATPVGMTVTCRSRLIALEGRRLTFLIEAFDAAGPVGTAEHERFLIDSDRFMQKAAAKREAAGDE